MRSHADRRAQRLAGPSPLGATTDADTWTIMINDEVLVESVIGYRLAVKAVTDAAKQLMAEHGFHTFSRGDEHWHLFNQGMHVQIYCKRTP